MFQTLLLPLIICTYQGAETFPSCLINTKHLFQAFQKAGLYDQGQLDAQVSDPLEREQYQRWDFPEMVILLYEPTLTRRVYQPSARSLQSLYTYELPFEVTLSPVQSF